MVLSELREPTMEPTYLDKGAHQNRKIGQMIAETFGFVSRCCPDLTAIWGPVSGTTVSRKI